MPTRVPFLPDIPPVRISGITCLCMTVIIKQPFSIALGEAYAILVIAYKVIVTLINNADACALYGNFSDMYYVIRPQTYDDMICAAHKSSLMIPNICAPYAM